MARAIRLPDISDIGDWPKAYQWMVTDLTRAINEAQANYLVALGLFCYSEIVGRHILRFRENNPKGQYRNNQRCFEIFAKEYLGYGEVLEKNPKLYDAYRHGLCHEYFIKVPPSGGSGVFVYYSDEDKENITALGIDMTKGVIVAPAVNKRFFIIEPYLDDFVKALRRLSKEMKEANWNPDI